jgi:DNA-binding protein
MSGRDLLYKPPVPQIITEEGSGTGNNKSQQGKYGGKVPGGRELGNVGDNIRAKLEAKLADAGNTTIGTPGPGVVPAYKAEYFNRAVSGVNQVNLRARGAQALRGTEGATDLRKIVIPPAYGIDNPDPAIIRSAVDLMGLEPGTAYDLASMLTRQGAIVRNPNVTKEMLEARLAMLNAMVKARKAALARMAKRRAAKEANNRTLALARKSQGKALDKAVDVAGEGTQLIEEVRIDAEGMHKRLAKMLGIKR